MINKKILVAASCAVALLVGCKSGGDDSTGTNGKIIPDIPVNSNITITKDNLPANVLPMNDKGFSGMVVGINNNGYIASNFFIKPDTENRNITSFLIGSKFYQINLDKHTDKCTAEKPWFGQILLQLAADNIQDGASIDICAKSLGGDDDFDTFMFFKYKNKIINWKDSWGDYASYLSSNITYMFTDKGEIVKDFSNDNPIPTSFDGQDIAANFNISDNGLVLSRTDNKLLLCNERNDGKCRSIFDNTIPDADRSLDDSIMSSNSSYIYTLYYKDKGDADQNKWMLKLLKNNNGVVSIVEDIETPSTPDLVTPPVSVTDSGFLANGNSEYFYSAINKKLVLLPDMLKLLKLDSKVSDDDLKNNKFQLFFSPNGKYVLFVLYDDREDGDISIIKEIDRIYLPNGIDELVKTLPAKQV